MNREFYKRAGRFSCSMEFHALLHQLRLIPKTMPLSAADRADRVAVYIEQARHPGNRMHQMRWRLEMGIAVRPLAGVAEFLLCGHRTRIAQ